MSAAEARGTTLRAMPGIGPKAGPQPDERETPMRLLA